MRPLILTLSLLRGADASLTFDLAHRYGGHESNPFMPQSPAKIATVLAAETVAQSWALYTLHKAHPKLAKGLAWASIAIEGIVIRHNIGQYR